MPRTKKAEAADAAAVETKKTEEAETATVTEEETHEAAPSPIEEFTVVDDVRVDDARRKIAEIIVKKGDEILARPDRNTDPVFMNAIANLFNAIK